MPFPIAPINGQVALVNNISYVYNSANGAWDRRSAAGTVPILILSNLTAIVGDLSVSGGVYAGAGAFYSNSTPIASGTGGGSSSYTKNLGFDGTVVIGPGTARWYPDAGITVTNMYLTASTPPVSGNMSLQINKNGASIYSYVNLTPGMYRSNNYTINTTVTTTDYVTVDVINNGGAADATLTFTYTRN